MTNAGGSRVLEQIYGWIFHAAVIEFKSNGLEKWTDDSAMRLHGKLRRRLATSEMNSCHIAYANQRGPKVNYPSLSCGKSRDSQWAVEEWGKD